MAHATSMQFSLILYINLAIKGHNVVLCLYLHAQNLSCHESIMDCPNSLYLFGKSFCLFCNFLFTNKRLILTLNKAGAAKTQFLPVITSVTTFNYKNKSDMQQRSYYNYGYPFSSKLCAYISNVNLHSCPLLA